MTCLLSFTKSFTAWRRRSAFVAEAIAVAKQVWKNLSRVYIRFRQPNTQKIMDIYIYKEIKARQPFNFQNAKPCKTSRGQLWLSPGLCEEDLNRNETASHGKPLRSINQEV